MTKSAISPITDWPVANQRFYADFRRWLRDGGYGDGSLRLYGIAARMALGFLNKAYWMIDDADLERVRVHTVATYQSTGTRGTYRKGLAKLAEFLQHKCHRKAPQRTVNWDHYVGSLPDWLADDVRAYVAHRRRAWVPEQQHRGTLEVLSHLTLSLRWMAQNACLKNISDLDPALWFDFLDTRLEAGRRPRTVNRDLGDLQEFLRFLADAGCPVCERMLALKPLPVGPQLPRDVPIDQLRSLMQEIEKEANVTTVQAQRMGVMDRAWFHLMLHCGLRVGEVRRLCLSDLDLEGRRARIEQSKGLNDRIVFLSLQAVDALKAYLEIRGPANSDHVFIFRHRPLSTTYCRNRLRTYGRHCGAVVIPHQLRHSCATLLLNAGAPILAVKTILGHKQIDTTMGYARLYDGTLATDYYCAMAEIESRFGSQDGPNDAAPNLGQMLALLDVLRSGTLNQSQQEAVRALRAGILGLVERDAETTSGAGDDELQGRFNNPGSVA